MVWVREISLKPPTVGTKSWSQGKDIRKADPALIDCSTQKSMPSLSQAAK